MTPLKEWTIQQLSTFSGQKNPLFPEHFQDLLLFKEEWKSFEKDQWGNFEHTFSKRYWDNLLFSPCIDKWAKQNRKNETSLWPIDPKKNKPYTFAVCLTHDVDHLSPTPTFRQRGRELKKTMDPSFNTSERLTFFLKSLLKLALKPSKSTCHIEMTLHRCLEIEKECGVTASYFFTAFPIDPISAYDCLYQFNDSVNYQEQKKPLKILMQEMLKEGFDIGLHGSYFSAVVPGALKSQKKMLEEAIGQEVITTRQHYLHWEFPKTLRLQEEAGFKIDSSLGFNRNIGYRAGTGLPFKLYDLEQNRQSDLYELPLILQDGAMLGNNGLELPPEKMLSIMKSFSDQTKELGSCITWLFHPDLLADEKIAKSYKEAIIDAKEKGAWVTNAKQLYSWWSRHFQEAS